MTFKSPDPSAFRAFRFLAAALSTLVFLSTAQAQPGMAKWERWLTVDYAGAERAYPISCDPEYTKPEADSLDEAGRYRVVHSCVHNVVKVTIVDAATGAVALDTKFPYLLRRGHAPLKVVEAPFKVQFAFVKM